MQRHASHRQSRQLSWMMLDAKTRFAMFAWVAPAAVLVVFRNIGTIPHFITIYIYATRNGYNDLESKDLKEVGSVEDGGTGLAG